MRTLLLVSAFLLLGFNLSAQIELTTEQEQELEEITCFKNPDCFRGIELAWKKDSEAARPFLLRARAAFREQKNWEGFIRVGKELLFTYAGQDDYLQALEIAKEDFIILSEEAPKNAVSRLGYHDGIFSLNPSGSDWPSLRSFFLEMIELSEAQENWEEFAELNASLIGTYQGTEDFHKGLEQGEYALEKMKAVLPENDKAFFHVYRQIGMVAIYQRHSILALEYFSQMLRLVEATPENYGLNELKDTHVCVGLAHRDVGNLGDALFYLLKSESFAKQINPLALGDTQRHICYLFTMMNNFEKAIEYGEKTISNVLAYDENNGQLIFDSYRVLGECMLVMGEYEEGIAYYKKAIQIIENQQTIVEVLQYRELPSMYAEMGVRAYLPLGKWEQAKENLEKSLSIIGEHRGYSEVLIYALTRMSSLYLEEEHKDLEKATHYLEKAKQVHYSSQKITNADSTSNTIHVQDINDQYIQLLKEKGDNKLAKKYLQNIIAFNTETSSSKTDLYAYYLELGDIYIAENKLDSAMLCNNEIIAQLANIESKSIHKIPDPAYFMPTNQTYSILEQRAKILIKIHDNIDAAKDTSNQLEQALATIKIADKVHLNNLKKMNILRAGQSKNIIASSIPIYRQGLYLAHRYYQESPSESALESCFYYTQKMKAQQLWLTQLKSNAKGYAYVPNELLEQERILVSEIDAQEKLLLAAQEREDTETIKKIERADLFDLKRAHTTLVRKIALEYPDYHEAKYQFDAETGASLQSVLKEHEILVEYVLAEKELFIFTLTKYDALRVQKIELKNETKPAIKALYQRLQSTSWMRRSSREKFVALSYQLYQQFIAPIEAELAGKKRLIIIGDGLTNYIPFETLLASGQVKSFHELDYLLKTHEISYHYSSNLFAKARKQEQTATSGIYAFAPVYDKVISDAKTDLSSRYRNGQLHAFDGNGNFTSLPESEREVKAIMALFKGKEKSEVSLRKAANEAKLKSSLEQNYQYVHIAGHSFADLENPKFSGIACFEYDENSSDSIARPEDGMLYTGEIYNINTQADLVTLSSCESGYGKLDASEGILGINRAFIYSGTPNVVFSLWKIYDKVSADLMIDFYGQVLEGKTYAESLRAAKLNVLNNEITAAPHFWSPFLLIGR